MKKVLWFIGTVVAGVVVLYLFKIDILSLLCEWALALPGLLVTQVPTPIWVLIIVAACIPIAAIITIVILRRKLRMPSDTSRIDEDRAKIRRLRKENQALKEEPAKASTEIDRLKEENKALKKAAKASSEATAQIDNLASLDESIAIEVEFRDAFESQHNEAFPVTWKYIFQTIGPYLLQDPGNDRVSRVLATSLVPRNEEVSRYIASQDLQTIKIQFVAMGLIESEKVATAKGNARCWCLTDRGNDLVMKLRTVKSEKPAGYQ